MATSKLSELAKNDDHHTISVVVSRRWHFRGGTDEGPIVHTDLVLIDSEGTYMYAQVPSVKGTAERLINVLQEGKVYVIKKFLCKESKTSYMPVDGPLMVQFTRYTTVEPKPGLEDSYPFCTYSLTAFTDIPKPSHVPGRFTDVIGRITMVSDVTSVQSMYQTTASDTRTIMLTDLLGQEMKIILWGNRAVEFDGEAVCAMGAKEPVVAIFVGLLSKVAKGVRILTGSAACRWYIDEDVPDINSFRASLGEEFIPLASYVPTGPDALVSRVQDKPTDKTVKELTDLDPFVDMDKRFLCTITIDSLGTDQRWWFSSCATCRKSSKHNGHQYRCSDDTCSSVDADPTYCVSVFASDGTAGAEFVMFDKVAAGAIGKPLVGVLRQRYPGCATVDEMANLARHDVGVPPQIAQLVGQKYKLMVSISKKWKVKNTEELSFQVNRVEETYKPELPPFVTGVASGSGKDVSITDVCGEKLPVLPPVLSPGLSTPPSAGPKVGSPASRAHTLSPASNLSPSAPSPRAAAPKRGARRSLFGKSSEGENVTVLKDGASSSKNAVETVVKDLKDGAASPKDSVEPVVKDLSLAVGDEEADALPLVDDPSKTNEQKNADATPPRIKRPPTGGKGSGGLKKQKQ